MNSAQTFFFRFYFPRSFPAFMIQFLGYLTQAERLLCSYILRNAFASRIGVSEECECWLLLEFSALKYSSPNFHHVSSAPS